MHKVVMLGFDGLEYTLVERGPFTNLKQREFGRVDISCCAKKGEHPATPMICTSFITGTTPERHGIKTHSVTR